MNVNEISGDVASVYLSMGGLAIGFALVIYKLFFNKIKDLARKLGCYRNIVESLDNGYALHEIIYDECGEPADFRYLDVNSAFEALFQLKRADVIGNTVLSLFPQTELPWLKSLNVAALSGKATHSLHCYQLTDRYLDITVSCPGPGLVSAFFTDMTEQQRYMKKLTESEEQQRALIEQASEGIFIANRDGQYTDVNGAGCQLLGLTCQDIVGKGISDFIHPTEIKKLCDVKRQILLGNILISEFSMRCHDGSYLPVEMSSKLLSDGRWQCFVRDISERKRMEAHLNHLAHHDALTGLLNRLAFSANLEQALARARRHKYSSALLLLDLDNFKNTNDSLGHQAGDRMLQEVADRLKNCIREEDLVARLGGDEFTIILEQIAHVEDAAFLAQKIIDAVAKPLVINGHIVSTSASIGICIFPGLVSCPDDIVNAADNAMYRAKKQGRGAYAIYAAAINGGLYSAEG